MTVSRLFRILLGLVALLWTQSAVAQLDGHGPDAWRVTGVAADDGLNIRMGPGTDYAVIGVFGPDARGLEMVTCVPYLPQGMFMQLSEAERAALPSSWCLMQTSDFSKAGWVAQRFLEEDSGEPGRGPVEAVPAPVAEAEALVRRLYAQRLDSLSGAALSPLAPGAAQAFFFEDIAKQMAKDPPGADPLFAAQDFDGSVLSIAPDPDQPMLRGMVTIVVDYTNFGAERRAWIRLRADTSQPGSPMRIFSIEHPEWEFPED